jgi:hypothetical protein
MSIAHHRILIWKTAVFRLKGQNLHRADSLTLLDIFQLEHFSSLIVPARFADEMREFALVTLRALRDSGKSEPDVGPAPSRLGM